MGKSGMRGRGSRVGFLGTDVERTQSGASALGYYAE